MVNKKILLVLFSLLWFVPGPTAAGPVDHQLYDRVLQEYVDGGYFDYRGFMEDPQARQALRDYLTRMSRLEPDSLERDQELAYWINLYNAATLRLIEQNYPVESIRDIGGWFSGPWSISFVRVDGKRLTLDEIEHEIIRPRFEEPRIHFALVCAAKSCPPLRAEPYTAHKLDHQLTDQARVFLESSMNGYQRVNRDSRASARVRLDLSRIFYWYGEDFGGEEGVVDYVADFFPDSIRDLIRRDRYRVTYRKYDWTLNQAPGPYPPLTGRPVSPEPGGPAP